MANPTALLRPALAAMVAVAAVLAWAWLGRPVAIPAPAAPTGQTLQCASYTPLTGDETPDTLQQGAIPAPRIAADLELLAQRFRCVRTYSVTGLEAVPAVAQRLGLRVLLGAWVNADGLNSRRELDGAAALANAYPQTVLAVVVGNEVLLRRELGAERLVAYIGEMKGRVRQPVTYADVWEFILRHRSVSDAVDFTTVHILPYWDDEPAGIDQAVAKVAAIRAKVAAQLPDKPLLIGETGWPSRGRMRGPARPSPENQARFLREFIARARQERWSYNLVEAFDQPWKRASEGTVGGYWGIYDSRREDKQALAGPVSNHPHWPVYGIASAISALALLLPAPRRRPILTAVTALTGGLALGWQAEQFGYAARGVLEYGWAIAVLVTAFGATHYALQLLDRGTPLPPFYPTLAALRRGRVAGPLWPLLLVLLAAISAITLAVDPRYREFPTAAFALPALLLLLASRRPQSHGADRREEGALGALLVSCAAVTAMQETLYNLQGVGWVVTCLLLAVPLLRLHRAACSGT